MENFRPLYINNWEETQAFPFIKRVAYLIQFHDFYMLNTVVFEKLKVLIELTVPVVTLPCVRLKLLDDNDTV